MIWKLRQVDGTGWLREEHAGRPVVTAEEPEAFEFPTRDAAVAALRRMPAGVRWRVVERPARAGGPARRM